MADKRAIDLPLSCVVVGIMLFGILAVYSASCYTAKVNYGNEYYFTIKQALGVALGILFLIAFSFIDYHKLSKWKWIILIVSLILLALVFIPGIGVENYGAKRWIKFPFFTLQPSEIAKFGFVVFSSAYMSKNYEKMITIKGILPVLGVGCLICGLIILEPNMSVTMCVALLMFCMIFIGGARIKHLVGICTPFALLVPALIIAEPYRLKRLMAFINPWENPLAEGYQLVQSYYALGSGGLFGLGIFNSRQKYLFLPFAESDFIFSVIGEEFGFFGCVLLILAFVFVVWRAFRIAKKATDRFGGYLASGIGCLIAIQLIINIAVVSGSIPPTGIPLPFVSAGTSSLIVFCSAIGVLNNIRLQSDER